MPLSDLACCWWRCFLAWLNVYSMWIIDRCCGVWFFASDIHLDWCSLCLTSPASAKFSYAACVAIVHFYIHDGLNCQWPVRSVQLKHMSLPRCWRPLRRTVKTCRWLLFGFLVCFWLVSRIKHSLANWGVWLPLLVELIICSMTNIRLTWKPCLFLLINHRHHHLI